MPTITEPKRVREYANKANVVLGAAEAKLLMVEWAGGDGAKSQALVLVVGTDTTDGGAGVFIMADEAELSRQLKIANPTIKKGVRSWLAASQHSEGEVPASPDTSDLEVADLDSLGL